LNYIRTARPQMFSLESIPSTESIVNSFFFAKTHKKLPGTAYCRRQAPRIPPAASCREGCGARCAHLHFGRCTHQADAFLQTPPRGEGRFILICDRACWFRTAARR